MLKLRADARSLTLLTKARNGALMSPKKFRCLLLNIWKVYYFYNRNKVLLKSIFTFPCCGIEIFYLLNGMFAWVMIILRQIILKAWNLENLPQNKPGSKAPVCGSAPLCVFISYLHSFSLMWSQAPGMHLFISKLKNNEWKNAIKEETALKPPLPSMWILQEMNPLHSSGNHWGMWAVPWD